MRKEKRMIERNKDRETNKDENSPRLIKSQKWLLKFQVSTDNERRRV